MVQGLMFTAKEQFRLLPEEHPHLQQLLRSTRVSAGLAPRARTMFLLADGVSLRHIQAQTGMSPRRTLHWKKRWRGKRLQGPLGSPPAGRPPQIARGHEAPTAAASPNFPP